MGLEVKLNEVNDGRLKEIGHIPGNYERFEQVVKKFSETNKRLKEEGKDHKYFVSKDYIFIGKRRQPAILIVGKIIYQPDK